MSQDVVTTIEMKGAESQSNNVVSRIPLPLKERDRRMITSLSLGTL